MDAAGTRIFCRSTLEQTRVDKLVWEESVVSVRKDSLQTGRARALIDLVVRGQQVSACDLSLAATVVGFRRQALPGSQLLQYRWQVIFRDGEEHGNRLHLSDHQQTVRIARMNHVACIKEPQAHTATDWSRDAAIGELQFGRVDECLVCFQRASYWLTKATCVSSCCLGMES